MIYPTKLLKRQGLMPFQSAENDPQRLQREASPEKKKSKTIRTKPLGY
jgi:hypothetical protein